MGDWIAIVALALSVLSLWLQFGERRRADPIVRLVRVDRVGGTGRVHADNDLVITNAGAAPARDLTISASTPEGEEDELFFRVESFPIQIIAPGHEYRIHVLSALGGPARLTLTITWRDRRPFRQRRKTSISLGSVGT